MKLSYRSIKNAEATARYWNKSLDKPDWYKIEALSDDEAEILIYDVIGWPFNDAAELVRALAEMTQKTITVRINSPGGDLIDSVAIFNALQSHKSKIITRIESLAASSASIVALAGKEVQAYKNAVMMIHYPWVVTIGNEFDHAEVINVLHLFSENLIDIYSEHSNIGKKQAKELMKGENNQGTWMTAKEAKEKGFIDTIVDGKAIKAQFDLSMFTNTPDEILSVQESGRELTRKETERALRNAGASRDYARAMAAKGAGASDIDVEMIEDLLKLKIAIGGK